MNDRDRRVIGSVGDFEILRTCHSRGVGGGFVVAANGLP
jgi:hypothetical protein